MKLHAESRGATCWCVHDEHDKHVGHLFTTAPRAYLYESDENEDARFEASSVEEAVDQLEKLYQSGVLKIAGDSPSEDTRKPISGDLAQQYMMYQLDGIYGMAVESGLTADLLSGMCACLAKTMMAMSVEGRVAFIDAITAKIRRYVVETDDRMARQKEFEKRMDTVAESIREKLQQAIIRAGIGDGEDQKPEAPNVH